MELFDAMQTGMSRTENGAITNSSSLDANLDLFATIGASRGKNIDHKFVRAWNEDKGLATRILLWAGDVRQGAGERQIFKDLVKLLPELTEDLNTTELFDKVVELTRYDNLFTFVGTDLEEAMLSFYASKLKEGSALAAKWCPREKSAKRDYAVLLRKHMGLRSKEYRKMLSSLSDTVEQKMCAKEFDKINYEHVPSVASARYQKSFLRNDENRYRSYLDKLSKGEAKINAGAVYPYDIIKSMREGGNTTAANEQWEALPDYFEGESFSILPVVDTSGSMHIKVSGSTTAMDVAVSLGLYLSERIEGKFNNKFITFSERPSLQNVKGDKLYSKLRSLYNSDWGFNTNLIAVFQLVLESAVKHGLDQSELPNKIMIISDMEFDCACGGMTNFATIDKMFEKAGYKRPDLIFWNVCSRQENYPVQKQDNGTALVSGFSPSIMRSVLSSKVVSPLDIMYETVLDSRYDPVFLV
ncbi:MAG: hypothetical protein GOVbin4162_8 [Prokaryotic dsDNA virus sp.]|nr:MAG: hypothetical protein GOVbin4162_8 [Prokaryotic dsDNA virus sp.]